MRFVRESGAVLFNDQLIYLAVGDAGHVDFHYEQIWPIVKILNNNEIQNDLCFFHIHPDNFENYSIIDKGLMKAWAIVLPSNISFYFIIICNNKIITFESKIEDQDIKVDFYANVNINRKLRKKIPVIGLLQKLSYRK